MAKQVNVDHKKKPSKVVENEPARITTRSPLTNLFFAAMLGLIYLVVFNQSAQNALLYAGGAFLFFNTVDYCVLYYRMNKENK